MQLPTNHWYPVLQSREVASRPLGVTRLGERLVFWRDSKGTIHAHADRCPHLGAALSQGSVSGDRLVCAFHGFAFDGEGSCRHIPANGADGKIPKGMATKPYRVREDHGFVWLWWGEARASYPAVPFFDELATTGWRSTTMAVDWPVHYTRAIENQLDVAHLAFIHRTTIGRGGRTMVEGPYVEADERAIKVWTTNRRDSGLPPRSIRELAEAAQGTEPSLTLLFPGIWRLNISSGFKQLLAFVPIDDNNTRYYLRAYHRIRNPLLAFAAEVVLRRSSRHILAQDQAIVVTQTPRSSMDATEDRLIGADRAIAQFRRLHARMLERPAPASDRLPVPESAAMALVL